MRIDYVWIHFNRSDSYELTLFESKLILNV